MARTADAPTEPECPKCGAALPSLRSPCHECTAVGADTYVEQPAAAQEEADLVRDALGADYELIEELGRGGMAVVFLARERALEREVAIKVLPVARTFDAGFVERFQREARVAASLEHPHVVPVYRVGQSGRVNFIVMKYVRGRTLSTLLEDEGTLRPAEVERMLLEVGDALDYAHGRGVVHRDVKPDNVMRDEAGRYVVMDFGIAKSLSGTRLTESGASVGTPRYMSPEQARGGDLRGASDFYSLGVVGYHGLVGRPPFEGDDPLAILYSHLHDPVPEPALESAEARRVCAAVRSLLAKSPDERTRTAEDLRSALREPAPPGVEPGSAAGAAAPARFATRWLRDRSARFWAPMAALAALSVVLVSRGGVAADCRAALSGGSEGDRALLVEPIGSVERGAPVELSYVACGFASAEPLLGRVVIRPADGGGVVGRVGRFLGGSSDPVRVSWDDEADGYATVRARTITIGDLDVGAYRLTVTIEDQDGRDEEASHEFTVVDSRASEAGR